ncbi:hypothetical protein WDW86_01425 [Bdellovibrionota bacterium FG-2]
MVIKIQPSFAVIAACLGVKSNAIDRLIGYLEILYAKVSFEVSAA